MSVAVERDQHLVALQKGNEVRMLRAELKRDLKTGAETVDEILGLSPWWVGTMLAFDLVHAAPKFGPEKTRQTLRHCGVSPLATVGGLTDRQRRVLVEAVR